MKAKSDVIYDDEEEQGSSHFISALLLFKFSDMTEMKSCLQTLSTHFKTELRGLFLRKRHQTSDDSISKCILQFSDVPRNCSVEAKTFLNPEWKMSQGIIISVRQIIGILELYIIQKGEKTLCHLVCLIVAAVVIVDQVEAFISTRKVLPLLKIQTQTRRAEWEKYLDIAQCDHDLPFITQSVGLTLHSLWGRPRLHLSSYINFLAYWKAAACLVLKFDLLYMAQISIA